MSVEKWVIENRVVYDCVEGSLQDGSGEKIELKYNENILLNQLINGVFEKAELIEKIWGKIIVTDSSYHKLVFELRSQFERVGLDPKMVKTVPRRGCQLVGVFEPVLDQGAADHQALIENLMPPAECGSGVETQVPPEETETAPATKPSDKASARVLPGHYGKVNLRAALRLILIAIVGGAIGWQIANFMPNFYITKIARNGGNVFVVGLVYKDVPKLPNSSGDVFYIKSRKGTSVYLCDKKDRSDLNCQNQISF